MVLHKSITWHQNHHVMDLWSTITRYQNHHVMDLWSTITRWFWCLVMVLHKSITWFSKKMKNLSKRKNTFFNFKFWKSILVKPKSKVCNFQNPNSNDITVGLIRRQWKLHNSWWSITNHYSWCNGFSTRGRKVIKKITRSLRSLDDFFWITFLATCAESITFHS